MTQSIPNGFSPEDLQLMLAQAQPEPEYQEQPIELEAHEVKEAALNMVEEIQQLMDSMAKNGGVPPQLIGKLIIMSTVDRMIDWHTSIGQMAVEEGKAESAMGWYRDAGKFQSIMNILHTIGVCEEDFTMD